MQQIRKRDGFILILLLTIMAIVVWMSPEERTLGDRIKIVYVHVAFVWTGLLGILITGILSIGVFWQPFTRRLEQLLPIMNLTSVIFFGIGFLLSLLAAKINWGGILWTEPRAIAALRILSIAMMVQVFVFWFKNIRFRAGLYIMLLVFTLLINATVRNAVHPTNPIFSSDSNSFAISVMTLMGIVILIALLFMNMLYWQATAKYQT